MNIRKRLAQAAVTLKKTIFKRISTNPTTQTSRSYLDLIYDRDYKEGKKTYAEYKETMRDSQVKVGLTILQLFLLSREIHITPGGSDKIDKEAQEFVETNLFHDMKSSIRQVRKNIYTALQYGFSAQEIVYGIRDDGKVGIENIHAIHRQTLDHPDTFVFDKGGEIVALNQKSGQNDSTSIPFEKVLLYTFDMEFDDPCGNSLLEEIYDNVYMKKRNLKWLAIFLQKHASPFLLGKLGAMGEKFKDIMRQQLEEVSEGRTQMTVGSEDEVQILESKNKGEAFFKSLQYHDVTIFRRFFIGTLLLGQMDTSGSYAQSESQIDVTKMLLDGVHEEIAGRIQHFTDRLCEWNYSQAQAPKVSFEKFEEKDIVKLLDALQPYARDMLIDLEADWFGEVLSMVIKEHTGLEVDKDSILHGGELPHIEDREEVLENTLKDTLPQK